jgi:hypothetical protein
VPFRSAIVKQKIKIKIKKFLRLMCTTTSAQ